LQEEELIQLVITVRQRKCEFQHIEVKKAANGTPKRLYDTFSSFSNQRGGGIILFGVDEVNGFSISGVYDPQDLQKKVTQQAEQMIPIVRPIFTVAELDEKIVVCAEIAECDIFEKPCYYSGAGRIRGSYIRVGDADMPMTEYEIYSYEAFKRKVHDELRMISQSPAAVLNDRELQAFLALIKNKKPNLAQLNDETTLTLCGIRADALPTLAGILLFGLYPQGAFPQLCMTAVVVPGYEVGSLGDEGERFSDNKKLEGTIPQIIDGAMLFVQRNMKVKTIIDEMGKRADRAEYPIKAVREMILNALIHRDYSIHTENSPIRLLFFTDRVELENPGGLYGRITIDDLGKVGADTRNPFIASALEVMINTENRFSGIPTIRNEMKKFGLPEPLFESNRGVFRVTLFNASQKVMQDELSIAYDDAEGIVTFCKKPRTRQEIADKLRLTSISYVTGKYIQPLVDTGLLKLTRPETPKSKKQLYFSE